MQLSLKGPARLPLHLASLLPKTAPFLIPQHSGSKIWDFILLPLMQQRALASITRKNGLISLTGLLLNNSSLFIIKLMKKYFLTGLVTLLPLAVTLWIITFLIRLLTKPFEG